MGSSKGDEGGEVVLLVVGRDQGPPSETPWYTRPLTWPKASQVRRPKVHVGSLPG